MGIADAFGKEDRVEVTYSNFYMMTKGCCMADLMKNAVRCNVPHRYIREMISGVSEESVQDEKENEKAE